MSHISCAVRLLLRISYTKFCCCRRITHQPQSVSFTFPINFPMYLSRGIPNEFHERGIVAPVIDRIPVADTFRYYQQHGGQRIDSSCGGFCSQVTSRAESACYIADRHNLTGVDDGSKYFRQLGCKTRIVMNRYNITACQITQGGIYDGDGSNARRAS